MLTREQILAAANKLPVEKLHIPELGGDVYIRGMNGHERDAFEQSFLVGRGKKQRQDYTNARAKLAVRTLCDESGARLFKDHEADLLGSLPVSILQKIYEVAQRLSGVSDEDVDELEKSSAPTPEPISTSPSV